MSDSDSEPQQPLAAHSGTVAVEQHHSVLFLAASSEKSILLLRSLSAGFVAWGVVLTFSMIPGASADVRWATPLTFVARTAFSVGVGLTIWHACSALIYWLQHAVLRASVERNRQRAAPQRSLDSLPPSSSASGAASEGRQHMSTNRRFRK
jgi:hypothetical protein